MLARHSLEGADRRSRTKITTDSLELKSRNEISSTAQTTNNGENETKEAFHSLARHYAVSLANKFLQEPITAIQELPKFHHICIAYCALVLSEYASYCEISDEELLSLLQRLQEHYYEFSGEVPPAMNIAVERVKLCIRSKAPVCPSYRASLSMNHTATTSPAPEMHSESDITGEAVYQNGELQSVNMQDAGMEGPTDNIYDDLGYSTGLDDIGGMGTLFDGHFMSFMDFFNNNI
ncbi:hypothetical protein Plec18167_005855 [Paecilomyces lecythidis]|uniref:Uncharacterized protein n=1 Tax=Paecilomyces lecythidis TaxID=3004212 RepID=A0ABR3XF94_9EURO